MNGLIYTTGDGWLSFISMDSIIRITERKNGNFDVWFAKGYTNSTAELSLDELSICTYEEYLFAVSNKGV